MADPNLAISKPELRNNPERRKSQSARNYIDDSLRPTLMSETRTRPRPRAAPLIQGGLDMRRLKSSSFLVATTLGTLMLLAICALSIPGYAQVKPGDFITPENATKVRPGRPRRLLQGRARHVDEDCAD